MSLLMLWIQLSFMKLMYSDKIMSVIISIEMIVNSIMILWLTNELLSDQCYYYIMFLCVSVSESVMGLSIIISMLMFSSKIHSDLMFMKV